MNADNFFKNLFNKPKIKEEEEHDITIEDNQHEFNKRLESDEKTKTTPEANRDKE
jgi:hypothetical protein